MGYWRQGPFHFGMHGGDIIADAARIIICALLIYLPNS
jgi:hypothetical protein